MKAFVTGATGFLGSHLVDLLLQEGHEVRALVRKTSDLRWLKNRRIQIVYGNLTPGDAGLLQGLKEIDWCFHAAGLISTTSAQDYFTVNAGGTRHCLDACLKSTPKLKRFVLVSSIAACGPSQNGKALNETTPPHPLTDYGKSKLESEKIALQYKDRLPVTILRPPAIYGPRDKMILPVFRLAKRRLFFLPGLKPRYVSMVYVEDVARACLWAARAEAAVGEIFFIADGDIYAWQDIADCLAVLFYHKVFKIPLAKTPLWLTASLAEGWAKLRRHSPHLHRGHIRQFFRPWPIDITKIKSAGFTPRFHLEEGMKATLAGYRQMGWL